MPRSACHASLRPGPAGTEGPKEGGRRATKRRPPLGPRRLSTHCVRRFRFDKSPRDLRPCPPPVPGLCSWTTPSPIGHGHGRRNGGAACTDPVEGGMTLRHPSGKRIASPRYHRRRTPQTDGCSKEATTIVNQIVWRGAAHAAVRTRRPPRPSNSLRPLDISSHILLAGECGLSRPAPPTEGAAGGEGGGLGKGSGSDD